MSRPKFAPITSSLLARKGDARPWQPPPADFARILAPPPEDPPHADLTLLSAANHLPEDDGATAHEHTKRCALKLTPAEYERLGIIGVKKGMSRHQVLRQAFEKYLASIQHEYQTECGCLADCRNNC